MTTKLNPGKPDGGKEIIICDGCHFTFEVTGVGEAYCIRCQRMRTHLADLEGRKFLKSRNPAPSPQPSAEATEPTEKACNLALVGVYQEFNLGEKYAKALLKMIDEGFVRRVERFELTEKGQKRHDELKREEY